MKRELKKLMAFLLAAVMVSNVFLQWLPPMEVKAAAITKDMAHLVSGSSNGNGHFGGGTPEAFVLSEKADITNEKISATMKLGGEISDSRGRIVTKYVDDTHWSYIGFEQTPSGSMNWFAEYKNGDQSYYPVITGLPAIKKDDVFTVSCEYKDSGMEITVENSTTGVKGVGTVTDESFLALKDNAGKIGFGGATYQGTAFTDIYFADVMVGETAIANDAFAPYENSAAGYTWEQAADVVVGDDGTTDPVDPDPVDPPVEPGNGRKWINLQGGSNNTGGHNYGNAASSGPLFYTYTDQTMTSGGSISMALKPSNNWGVFYSYIDDSNWLYVGYDNSSKWYYQYRWNGQESYPQIPGLPEPVAGEELNLSIALNNETLEVTVDGTTVRVTNQTLKDMADALMADPGNLGKFGVMTKGATSISFADFAYNGSAIMDESKWAFNAERTGQTMEVTYTATRAVTGKVSDGAGKAVEGATVRIGANSAVTDENGNYEFEAIQVGDYTFSVSKPGYDAYSDSITVSVDGENKKDVVLIKKADLDLTDQDKYTVIESENMKVYLDKNFPKVVRYIMKSDATGETFFRGNETDLNTVVINDVEITPTVTIKEENASYRVYTLAVADSENNIDLTMDVKISVEANTLTWEVTSFTKNEGCADIATIDIPHLNLLSVDSSEEASVFAGAQVSTTTTSKADTYISFDDGFVPSSEDGYVYAFLSNGKLSAGLHSNSEIEGDKRVERINGADSMALTSAAWYYECGDRNGQSGKDIKNYVYPVSELPIAKVAIADGDLNGDEKVDWNDGAIAFRDVMHYAQDTEVIKDIVNYRIIENFASMAPSPYFVTADNIKKVYLATDGLPQAVMLKGYGNEGHDSANSEYADIAEREGGVEDFRKLIKIAHDYNTEVGVHVNAQEMYPEARSINYPMITLINGTINDSTWGWLDQSIEINKLWDLASQARLKRFVQFYDRINGTHFYSGDWEKGEYVKESEGELTAPLADITADAATRKDNLDFIYLDVWYQDAWETRRIAEQINSLGWRFSTEFSAEGEYDSTWQHWSTDAQYGGASSKGFNSDIIRFLRNDQRDSQVLNYPDFGGTADNPLLPGYRLYGFEGWQKDQNYINYIYQTFNQNLPIKFLQHYEVMKWVNYGDDGSGETSPVGNTEKEITLANDAGDKVVVTRNEEQRSDEEIERTITLNGKVILNTDVNSSAYLLPWIDNQNGEEKLYHWNLDGGTTTWELQDDWAALGNVVVYELSDQGRINEKTVAVTNGSVTLEAEASTPYVVVKGAGVKELKNDFGEYDYVTDPGFNGYAPGEKLDAADWSGDIADDSVVVGKSEVGSQQLVMDSPSKNVAVTTVISGLVPGEDYVAEIYVDNRSEAKATLTVDAGEKVVSNYTEESIATNYVACDNKNASGYDSKMQRMQISFVAESDTATLTLSREAGEGATYWDDIRIVNQKVDNFDENGNFTQDFESVVQGLYPFVLGSAQGVSDPRTHLSQANGEFTEKGFLNKRIIDDVIDGEWSLKHHDRNTGIVYQTIPQNFRFEPGKVYNVEFDYQAGSAGFQMVVGDGITYTTPTEYLAAATDDTHVEMQVIGSGSGQTWIGLYENASLVTAGVWGHQDFILDNLSITEVKDAKAVTVDKTGLYLGETAAIYGSGLDEITWTVSEEGIVSVDKDNNQINAVGEGSATVTATFADGTSKEFTFTVEGGIVAEIPREEYDGISSSANTEEDGGEPTPSGYAAAAADGDSSTYWHSNWSGSGFTVSESNPAVLTVDLGKTMEIGGFMFQQRPTGGQNGTVQQYSYRILDADRNVLTEGSHISVDPAAQTTSAWATQKISENVNARYIEISVEQGHNNYAALAEVKPILVEKIATKADLTDANIKAGESIALEAVPANGAYLKGLVWTSSDESIATVDKNGNVTALKNGTVTITVSNALGTLATCTVTITGEEEVVQAPENLKVGKVTKDSVEISWEAPKSGAKVSKYYVYVNGVRIGETTELSAAIRNLKAGTEYEIEVRAVDADGNESAGTKATATTKADGGSTEKPDKPDKPSKPGSGSSSGQTTSSQGSAQTANKPVLASPGKTGDEAPIMYAVIVMAAAAAAVLFLKKKRTIG